MVKNLHFWHNQQANGAHHALEGSAAKSIPVMPILCVHNHSYHFLNQMYHALYI